MMSEVRYKSIFKRRFFLDGKEIFVKEFNVSTDLAKKEVKYEIFTERE